MNIWSEKMMKVNKYDTISAFGSPTEMGALLVLSATFESTSLDVGSIRSEDKLLKDFQSELKKYINNREESITISYKTKDRNARDVMDRLYREFNKILDVDDYKKHNILSTRYYVEGIPGDYRFKMLVKYRELKGQKQHVKVQAKGIIESIIKPGMDEHEKVKAIYDYILMYIHYDTTHQMFTLYEALANRPGFFQGYTLLTYELLKAAGIQNYFISGENKVNKVDHAWNLVNIEDKWYHLDTTFNDPIQGKPICQTYTYFNMSDEQLSKDHEWDRSKYPSATTSYFNELTNKIKAGSSKTLVYKQMLKETNLRYLSAEYGVENYGELKGKLQQQFASKPDKVEVRYKQSMKETMLEVETLLNEITLPKDAKRISYKVVPYSEMSGYSIVRITFTY